VAGAYPPEVVDLPDVERLLTIPAASLRAFGQRLRAMGLEPAFLKRLARVGDRLDDALRAPMRIWNARRMREPAAIAARLFMLHDAVGAEQARAALGALEPLLEGGLIEETRDGIESRVHLALAADVFCFGDLAAHGDAVMPLCGATLDLVRAAMPNQRVSTALDVGCGAGAVGLLLARAADRVVATDVNPRALAFARFNAALNDIGNIDLRQGDLFEPVRGEHYALIVAQPPFIALREGASRSTFMHGGTRGDEVSLRLIAEAAPRLAPGGRALVLADWPLIAGDGLDVRVRSALGEARIDALVLQSPSKNLDEYCVLHAAMEHPNLGDAFARSAIAQRDHLDRLAIQGLGLALVVLESAQRETWTSQAGIRHWSDAAITTQAIDRLMAAHRLAHAGREAIDAARLRLPQGAHCVDQPMPNGDPASVVVTLPSGRPEWPVVLDAYAAAIVSRIAAAPTVLDAARAIAREQGVPPETLQGPVEKVARDALLRGALDIA
jgi:SAM-dependent methyltransferase